MVICDIIVSEINCLLHMSNKWFNEYKNESNNDAVLMNEFYQVMIVIAHHHPDLCIPVPNCLLLKKGFEWYDIDI